MELWISATTCARIMGYTSTQFRAIRIALHPAIPMARGRRTGSGRTPDLMHLPETIHFLDQFTGGISREKVEELTDAASPL